MSPQAAPAAGDVAPALNLVDQEGQLVHLPDGDRPTVLVFYRGDW